MTHQTKKDHEGPQFLKPMGTEKVEDSMRQLMAIFAANSDVEIYIRFVRCFDAFMLEPYGLLTLDFLFFLFPAMPRR